MRSVRVGLIVNKTNIIPSWGAFIIINQLVIGDFELRNFSYKKQTEKLNNIPLHTIA